jgi:hypothetical protein
VTAFTVFPGPGALAAGGAAVLQEPVVTSPLPGGVAAVVRFLFNVPAWFQIGGALVGVLLAAAVVWVVWRRRAPLLAWLRTRSRAMTLALGVGAVLLIVGATGFGAVGWNYMQHDNGFCTGCHVMGPAFERFSQSEHAQLSCHDCHQQSMFASMRQLYLWVAERPAEIGAHAPVANRVCARCHITDRPERWQHVASTAGHRTHLESDSGALRGVQCVTCHGVEVHRFVPVSATCGQSGCHGGVAIVLGKMANQTEFHCVACHEFTADVPRLATRDSATGTLVPGMTQCLSCHEMGAALARFNPVHDPHRGTCGMCHNPHRQTHVTSARQSCASAGCHADWRAIPFHVGAKHRGAAPNCTTCHLPHQARVDASDCAGCHADVRRRHGERPLPVPFDTAAALQRTSWRHDAQRDAPKGKGDAPPPEAPPGDVSIRAPPDSFEHARHTTLDCITCHDTPAGDRLTFAAPRGCQICHHQAPATNDCASCHAAGPEAPRTVHPRVTVAGRPPRPHTAQFRHTVHDALRCAACHTTPVSLAPGPEAAGCTGCHALHHGPDRDCAACHAETAERRAAHAPPVEAHVACSACHAPAVVELLYPDRSFCLACHAQQRDHHTDRPCTECHLQMSPDAFADRLQQKGGA